MSEQNQQPQQMPEIKTYEEPIYVARTLTILCGFASQGIAWDSTSGKFYQSSVTDDKLTWVEVSKFQPRKLTLPMLELLKTYASRVPDSNMYLCTPREIQNIFHGLFKIPLI